MMMTDEMKEFISGKSVELFEICDKEKKGFIIKRDIQRVRDELAVEPEQLEDVFDSLDTDHNGFLTLDEFTTGFSQYLTNQMSRTHDVPVETNDDDDDDDQLTDGNEFQRTLEQLGVKGVYDDEEILHGLWIKLRNTDPILLRQFEEFLLKTTEEIKRSKSDHRNFELALQNKSSLYDDEIKRLYEEMEQEIHREKATILEQEKQKEREIREQMEKELHRKEQELNDVLRKQMELEFKFLQSNSNENEMKFENEQLQKEKVLLEEQLQEISQHFQESKNYIAQLQSQTKKEKRDRAKQALNLTENLAMERENLVKELNLLKSVNKQLLDERDLFQPSDDPLSSAQRSTFDTEIDRDGSEPEEDDDDSTPYGDLQDLGLRQQPVGANAVVSHSEFLGPSSVVPDRLFKVAFVGDSGVGKTSFIQRFCTNTFNESFAATIGVDLQIKMVNVNNRVIALQLWDTAGQERFRSITKQYFRKADGIILIYDVTSEGSFRNVRSWMTSIQESIEDDCVVVLVGNKIDLCDHDDQRAVKYKDGAKLADEYGCLFFESSARCGVSMNEPMETIAQLMQEKDERLRQGGETIQISSQKKKRRSCC